VTGLLAYLVTNLSDQPRIWSLTLSTFLGGVILVVQFLIAFEQRLENLETGLTDHGTTMTALVERRLGEISEVVELVEQSTTRQEVIQFLRHALRVDPSSPLLNGFAHAEIRRVTKFLKELGDGYASYPGEDRDWLLALTRSSEVTIDATSLPTVDVGHRGHEDGFWDSDFGRRYLELQAEAIGRGVRVRRIFVQDTATDLEEEAFRRMCQRHVDLGIKVRVLRQDALPPVPQSTLVDFILFDGEISYQVIPAAGLPRGTSAPTIINTLLVRRDDVLNENRTHFEAFWEAAVPVDRLVG
jgi:hypothetical protein